MKRTRQSSRFLRIMFILVVGIAILLVLFGNARQWYIRVQQRKEVAALEEEIRRLREERNATAELLEDLRSPEFIEREARERLGYKRDGETTVIFPAEEKRIDDETTEYTREAYSKKWIEYFFAQYGDSW